MHALKLAGPVLFLSTLSLRRATCYACFLAGHSAYFYPRSPCGERRIGLVFMWWGVRFLSTLSLRRATRCQASDISVKRISIHALLAESDRGAAKLLP